MASNLNYVTFKNVEDDFHYCVRKGLLVVFNFVNFNHYVTPRYAAHSDVNEFVTYFKEKNFSIEKHLDLTKRELIVECNKVVSRKDIEGYDCIMVLISSHGNQTGIICKDNETILLNDIIEIFSGQKSRIQIQTPKIFFIQACRGDEDDKGIYILQKSSLNDCTLMSDSATKPFSFCKNVFVAYSTTENKKAYSYPYHPVKSKNSGKLYGSWFILCLLSIFKEYSEKDDLLTMLTRVNKAMCLYGDEEEKKQISSQVNRLTYKIYFTKNL
ncbi:caspase-3-like [Hydra vulgaris]|uniref:Caspase D n=1 Tax=Hydra vulgaris TaxID=6087 RepID=D1MAR2_HYDVU|nr:caspase-3-like [Hydra vulgaris]ACY95433.1 caspase D [Hydra vulgaris]